MFIVVSFYKNMSLKDLLLLKKKKEVGQNSKKNPKKGFLLWFGPNHSTDKNSKSLLAFATLFLKPCS